MLRKVVLGLNFRKLRGCNLPYREQGLIWFICSNFEKQPKELQKKIKDLCKEVAGEYHEALFAMLTRENVSISWIERTYHVSASQLYAKRKIFYERWKTKIGFEREHKRGR